MANGEGSRDPTKWIAVGVQVAVAMASVIVWGMAARNAADLATHDLSKLEISMSEKIGQLRDAVAGGLADVRSQIAGLPDQRARLTELERREIELDARLTADAVRISAQEKQTIELRADLNQTMRTVNAPLSAGRR
jgi:hypothetical protein